MMKNRVTDVTFCYCVVGTYGDYISTRLTQRSAEFVFIDIGANQGVFSLIAAGNPSCRATLSFEPNPETFDYLLANISLNSSTKIVPVCAAVASPGQGPMELFVADGHSGGASMFGSGRSVEAQRFDFRQMAAFLDEHVGAEVVCKLDVEGAETFVLNTLDEIDLLSRFDELIVEVSDVSGGGGHQGELLRVLQNKGWVEVSRSGSKSHYDATFRRSGGARQT